MESTTRLKKKINALLAKTTENGATKEEALTALNKAQELMKQHLISASDLKETVLDEECVLASVRRYPTKYKEVHIIASLGKLFYCKSYYNKSKVYFYGFKEDTELCLYFYNFIVKSSLEEAERYKKTIHYKRLTDYHHGITIISDFVKGFLLEVSSKVEKMYEERQKEQAGTGLVIFDQKQKKVSERFAQTGIKLRTVKDRISPRSSSFSDGKNKGSELNITQGVNGKKKKAKQLN